MLLTPFLESLPYADKFIGPNRDQSVVPVRELTFQALKPKPPGDWRVIVLGQNPVSLKQLRDEYGKHPCAFQGHLLTKETIFFAFLYSQYPPVESATGVVMFDNAFSDWESKNFGKASSMRCIIKAAAMAKHGIVRETAIPELRQLLKEKNVVAPPTWFQAMLAQGVLLLNTSLTVGGDMKKSQHTNFWRLVMDRILEHILLAKSSFDDDDERRGILFL